MKKEEWKKLNKKQWEIELKVLLRTNKKALLRSVVCIYDSQTNEEKMLKESKEENGIGFTKKDAKCLSNIAKKIRRGDKIENNYIILLRKRMPKYWKQLMNISLDKFEKEEREKERIIKQQKTEQFRINQIQIDKCLNEGIPCEYGICSECFANQINMQEGQNEA